jgi:hypothetical protein
MHRRIRSAPLIILPLVSIASAQPLRFTERILQKLHNETISGYALQERTLVTWGDRLLWRGLPQGDYQVVRGRGRAFAEGGCLLDVQGRGQLDIVVNEGGPERDLVWFGAPQGRGAWVRHVIDTGVDAPDMLPATLLGHRGVLLIHKRMQVRFYEIPADPAARWPSRELYSFYSPSHQGGLRMADIDGDGLPDILAGMYWIRSPESLDLPWRLFAITLWNETPESAMLRLSYTALGLVAAQREMQPARLARFEKPADPRQLWIEHRIASVPDLAEVNSLETADLDGDGRPDILLAEKGGKGRLLVLFNLGDGRFQPQVISEGRPVLFATLLRQDILAIRPDAILLYENRAKGHL